MILDTLWIAFRHSVVAKDAGEDQLSEMKMAFYAGAKGILDAQFVAVSDLASARLFIKQVSEEMEELVGEKLARDVKVIH